MRVRLLFVFASTQRQITFELVGGPRLASHDTHVNLAVLAKQLLEVLSLQQVCMHACTGRQQRERERARVSEQSLLAVPSVLLSTKD